MAESIFFECHNEPPAASVLDALAVLQACAYAPIGMRGWTAEEIASLMAAPANRLLVAYDKNTVLCGFILAAIWDEEGEILSLAVNSDYRRQGIASRLVDELVVDKICVKNFRLVLEVASTNCDAIKFYEMLRFREIGKRRNYYLIDNIRIDARLMERRFSRC